MNVNTVDVHCHFRGMPTPNSLRQSKARSYSSHLCLRPRATLKFLSIGLLSYIVLSIGILLLLFRLPGSESPQNQHIPYHPYAFNASTNDEKKNIKLRGPKRDESQLPDMSSEIEQSSRAFPIWIDNRLAVDNSSRPYDWCVSEDLATKGENPKGLLFVKAKKTGSSTAAGVTLRIRDGLSKRLNHLYQNAPANCFARYRHAFASQLNFQKRDPSQSFLWSIVREPAQRTLSHYFFLSVSIKNRTATEDKIMAVLRSSEGQNYQSKYLDLPSQNEQSSSSTERIINGYDFLAVNERMEESLVVLAMLAQIPLADVVVFSAKTAGGYYYNGSNCVKLKHKWTTPKIEEYIHGEYQSDNKDDYMLYNAAQRSLEKTIDALGRHRVEENIELLKSLQQQNEKQCASELTLPCPEPEDEEKRQEHKRLVGKSCYFSDVGCGHACTDLALADYAEKEWLSMTFSSFGQGFNSDIYRIEGEQYY